MKQSYSIYFCVLFAQFFTKSKVSEVGLVKIYTQTLPRKDGGPSLGGYGGAVETDMMDML